MPTKEIFHNNSSLKSTDSAVEDTTDLVDSVEPEELDISDKDEGSGGKTEKQKAEEGLRTISERGGVVVDTDDVNEQAARRIAEKNITERQNRKGFRGFLGRVYLRVFEDVEKYREVKKARAVISEKGIEGLDEECAAIVERVTLDLMHEGESSKDVQDDLTVQTLELIKGFARGELDEKQFEEKRQELVDSFASENRDVFLKNEAKTDNIFEIAKQARAAFKHGANLDILDKDFKMRLARVRGGARTEADMGKVDRMVGFMQKTPGLNLIAPETAGVVLGAIYSASVFGAQSFTRSKLAAISTLGATAVFGFVFGTARRNKELKSDLAMHTREKAAGDDIDTGPRRREIDRFTVEMKSASDMTDQINEILNNPEIGVVEASQLFELIAEAKARVEISDQENIDLIAYSNAMEIEQERTELDKALAMGRSKLDQIYPKDDGKDIDDLFRSLISSKKEDIYGEMSEKSDEFKKFRIKESLKAGGKGAVIGLVAGGVMAEIVGVASSFVDSNDIGATARTPLQSLYDHFGGGPRMNSENLHDIAAGTHGAVKLPDGVDLLETKDGTFSLYNSVDGKNIVENLTMNPDGSFTQESMNQLNQSGIHVTDNVHQVIEEHSRQVVLTDQEAIQQRPELERVYRDMWFDNDTKMYMGADGNMYGADHNELGLRLGGVDGTGIDEQGNYVFDVSHMTPDGSWHDGLSTDFQKDIEAGNLKLNMSLSEETQRFVASVDINEKGQAIIPKNSELAKMFFDDQNGHAVFKGRFAEVSEVIGQQDGHDVVRMLATAEGNGVSQYTSTVVDKVSVDAHQYILDIPRDTETMPPPIIPIFGRRALEQVAGAKSFLPPEYLTRYGDYRGLSRKELEKLKERSNPEFMAGSSVEYRNSINFYIERMKENNSEYYWRLRKSVKNMESMTDECKAVVCIPVAADDYHNIEECLSQYLMQIDESGDGNLRKFRIILNINSLEPSEGAEDPNIKAVEVAESFKRNHPELTVDILSTHFSQEEYDRGGLLARLRKEMADSAIMLSEQRPSSQGDIALISNDVDVVEINRNYIASSIRTFEDDTEKNIDMIQGRIDWDPRELVKYPLGLVGTRVFQFYQIYQAHARGDRITSGANSIIRGSSYCNVGGYLSESSEKIGEDLILGSMIMAKKGSNAIKTGKAESTIITDERRALDAIIRNVYAADQWARFGINDELRGKDFKEKNKEIIEKRLRYNFDDEQEVERFRVDCEREIGHWLENKLINDDRGLGIVLSHGFGLKKNIDYRFENGRFYLLNAKPLINGIKNLQERIERVVARKVDQAKRLEASTETEPQNEEALTRQKTEVYSLSPEEAIERVKVLALRVASGERDFSSEELQLQKNYPNELEAELQRLQAKEREKNENVTLAQVLEAAGIKEGGKIKVKGEDVTIRSIRESESEVALYIDLSLGRYSQAGNYYEKDWVDLRSIVARKKYDGNPIIEAYRRQKGIKVGRKRISK